MSRKGVSLDVILNKVIEFCPDNKLLHNLKGKSAAEIERNGMNLVRSMTSSKK